MGRNLNYQFKTAIDKNFKAGTSKHSLKAENQTNTGRIFSYSDRNNMRDFSKNFSNFMKENHPEIKMAKDIKEEHCQSFLNSKKTSCSDATLKQYQSKFNKLEKQINNTYNSNVSFKTAVPKSESSNGVIRDKSMNRDDFNKALSTFKNQDSNGAKAMQISANWGLRVSEVAKLQGRDIDLQNNVIHVIDGKGGRDRDVQITEQSREYAEYLKQNYADYERIVPIRADSINVAVNRSLERAELKEEYKDTSIHSIRKMYAQEQYDNCRANGLNIQESLNEVSELLGHSSERGQDRDLMNRYVNNIH